MRGTVCRPLGAVELGEAGLGRVRGTVGGRGVVAGTGAVERGRVGTWTGF